MMEFVTSVRLLCLAMCLNEGFGREGVHIIL